MSGQRPVFSPLPLIYKGFPHSSADKESAAMQDDPGSIPGSGRSTGEGISYPLQYSWASLVAQLIKIPPAMRETWVRSGVGKIPWIREGLPTPVFWPGEFQDCIAHGVAKSRTRLSDFTFTFHCHALEKKMATHSSVLAWRIPGMGQPGGLPSMGLHRVGHD